MSSVSKPERATQRRVVGVFESLGYTYLGDWGKREGNRNVEDALLTASLQRRGYDATQAGLAVRALQAAADRGDQDLYPHNRDVFSLLRYGVEVQAAAGEHTTSVQVIDWDNPEANDFAVAQEVTLRGEHDRRPDLVLYVNGIAVGVIELKNSRVGVGEGIAQLLSAQEKRFHAAFFSTVQLVFAGNDSAGLRYGTTGTPAKFFLTWKEEDTDGAPAPQPAGTYAMDRDLARVCDKARLIELMRDFVLFDGGIKKVPRPHQYFGVKAAQARLTRGEGGVIWHTQGSGKSIVMVLLARWILAHDADARVLVVTDRDELDKQIARVFTAAGETIHRSTSGRDLLARLAQPDGRLIASLVHKFGRHDEEDAEQALRELAGRPVNVAGRVHVFVDECHRTQSGTLHKMMKAVLPHAPFVGFTGTPLLKKDKQTSLEVFGRYIHTYKFNQAVRDRVALDLVYEARDIDQRMASSQRIDEWFAAKTQGLNAWQQDELKKKWGTLQKVLSSASRMDQVVNDIAGDFSTRDRLASGRGNAILVAGSIYEACRYFEKFNHPSVGFQNRCAVVTSYNPQASDISKEATGAATENDKQFIYRTYETLLQDVKAAPGKSKAETYEDHAKKTFVDEPAQMKLLIVVDKLLTGFDAPSCTYLYLDKSMQDHGLFQAICRTNRLDGEDKLTGHVVDYKDLFKKVEKAIAVYTSEIDTLGADGEDADPGILLKDRLEAARNGLDDALETAETLCETVPPPKTDLAYMRWFCGPQDDDDALAELTPRRVALYKAVAALMRRYANLSDAMGDAGYTPEEAERIRGRVDHFVKVRDVVKQRSGEVLDVKPFEADMRFLIDRYLAAEPPEKISHFEGGLLELIVDTGIAEAIAEKLANLNGNQDAIAETIDGNVRKKIVKDRATDPAFYDRMSTLLDEVIKQRRTQAIAYEEYLARVAELAAKVSRGTDDQTPAALNTRGKRAIFGHLQQAAGGLAEAVAESPAGFESTGDPTLDLALCIDHTVLRVRPDRWRGNPARENVIKQSLFDLLGSLDAVEAVFPIIEAQRQEY